MDMQVLKVFLTMMLALVSVTWATAYVLGDGGKDDAMTVCQLSHSHDVCFQALNR